MEKNNSIIKVNDILVYDDFATWIFCENIIDANQIKVKAILLQSKNHPELCGKKRTLVCREIFRSIENKIGEIIKYES